MLRCWMPPWCNFALCEPQAVPEERQLCFSSPPFTAKSIGMGARSTQPADVPLEFGGKGMCMTERKKRPHVSSRQVDVIWMSQGSLRGSLVFRFVKTTLCGEAGGGERRVTNGLRPLILASRDPKI